MADVQWVFIAGGECRFGDRARPVQVDGLWWSATPITLANVGIENVDGEFPVTGVDHDAATRLAAWLGGRLPRSTEWEWMAGGASRRRYPWGDQPWQPHRAALGPAGHAAPTRVGQHPGGVTPDGLWDVAGNVWEWTATTTLGGGAVIRGGSYASPPLYARTTFLNAAPIELRSPGIGVRVVKSDAAV